jgi:hypothetical protein
MLLDEEYVRNGGDIRSCKLRCYTKVLIDGFCQLRPTALPEGAAATLYSRLRRSVGWADARHQFLSETVLTKRKALLGVQPGLSFWSGAITPFSFLREFRSSHGLMALSFSL